MFIAWYTWYTWFRSRGHFDLAHSQTSPHTPARSATANDMGKSIRSKSKRKFRAIKRKEVFGPAAKIKQFEALSNLRRSVGLQTSARASVEELRAMLAGRAPVPPTTTASAGALPDASDALGLGKWREDMDKAEQGVLDRQNDHFSFKSVAAPDYQAPVAWKTSAPDKKMVQLLLQERERAEAEMDVVVDAAVLAKREEMVKRAKRNKDKKKKAKRRKGNNVQRP